MIALAMAIGLVCGAGMGYVGYRLGWKHGRDFAADIAVQTFTDTVMEGIAKTIASSRHTCALNNKISN